MSPMLGSIFLSFCWIFDDSDVVSAFEQPAVSKQYLIAGLLSRGWVCGVTGIECLILLILPIFRASELVRM